MTILFIIYYIILYIKYKPLTLTINIYIYVCINLFLILKMMEMWLWRCNFLRNRNRRCLNNGRTNCWSSID